MMKVNAKPGMDMIDLISPDCSNSVEDSDVPNLTSDFLKSKDHKTNTLLKSLTNGQNGFDTNDEAEGIIDLDEDVDMDEPVSAELEEILLADDEPSEINGAVADGILEKKNKESTTAADDDKIRDAGADLDTLLSKINNIVEDCDVSKNIAGEKTVTPKSPAAEKVADESVMIVDDEEAPDQGTEQSIMIVDEEEEKVIEDEIADSPDIVEVSNFDKNATVAETFKTNSKVSEPVQDILLEGTAEVAADSVVELQDDLTEDVVMLQEETVNDEMPADPSITSSDIATAVNSSPDIDTLVVEDDMGKSASVTQDFAKEVEVANKIDDAVIENAAIPGVAKEANESVEISSTEPKHVSTVEDPVVVETNSEDEAKEEHAKSNLFDTLKEPNDKKIDNKQLEKSERPEDIDLNSDKVEEQLDESILEISDDDIVLNESSKAEGLEAATTKDEKENKNKIDTVSTNVLDTDKQTEEVVDKPVVATPESNAPATKLLTVDGNDTSNAKESAAPAIAKNASEKTEERKPEEDNLEKQKSEDKPAVLAVDDSDEEIIFVKADVETSNKLPGKKAGKVLEDAKVTKVVEASDVAAVAEVNGADKKDINEEKVETNLTSVVEVKSTAVEVEKTVVVEEDDDDVLLVEDDSNAVKSGVEASEDVNASEGLTPTHDVTSSEELKATEETNGTEDLKALEKETGKAGTEVFNEKAVTAEDSEKAAEQLSSADSLSGNTNEIPAEKKEEPEKDGGGDSAKSNEDAKESENDGTKLIFDNSDNACDGLGSEKPDSKKDEATCNNAVEETTSNGSSSSNLLKVSHKPSTDGDDANDSNSNDDEEAEVNAELDEEGDVVTIGDDDEVEEAAPPSKRPRLSEERVDSEATPVLDTNAVSEKQPNEAEIKTTTPLKRSHDSVDEDETKVDSNSTKKVKTLESAVPLDELKAQPDVKPSDDCKIESKSTESSAEDKSDIKLLKGVPSYIPVPLYPPPNLDANEKKFRLEFLKKFKKSFVKMTKADLEELVMQKLVEAIVYQSEFADMRKIIEKQEKTIVLHRSKLIQISRQFRELEKVHSDVLTGLESRTTQVIMPTKITRSVCLQASVPVKKANDTPVAPRTPVASVSTTTPSPAPAAQAAQKSPQRPSPQTSVTTAQASSTPDARSPPNTFASGSASVVLNQRRPYPPKMIVQQRAADTSPVSSTTYTNPTQRPAQNILNKNAPASTFTAIPPRGGRPNMQEQVQRQQQLARQQLQQQQLQNNGIRKVTVKPSTPTTVTPTPQVYRRNESMAQQTVASASIGADKYMTSINQLSPGMPTTVSITPARPKEKTVIDLTDEDDAATVQTATVRQRATTPNATTNNAAQRVGATMMTRIPVTPVNTNKPAQMTARKATAMPPKQNGNSSVATPSGTSITRIHVNQPMAAARKTSFPPPLPPTPPQTVYNASWKLPPPRPTIRISNLDNGIVISWTMEESMERYADCVSYQIYAYQETSSQPTVDSWRMVGNVKAMLLPMAVTLTQFQEGQRYYFAIRAIDCHQRVGPFSSPKTWN